MTWRRNLGVIIDRSLELTVLCSMATKKPSKTLDVMRKGFENKTEHTYTTLVHPHLK